MNNLYNKFISVVLAVALLMCMPFSTAFATSPPNMEEGWNDGENEVETNLIFPDIKDDGGITLTKIWDMTATRVEDELDTRYSTGKVITRNGLPTSAKDVYISGTLYHSVTGSTIFDYLIRAGLACIESQTGDAIPFHYVDVDRGVHFTEKLIAKTNIDAHTTFYGYISNRFTSGYVYGNIAFYYSVT